MFIIIINVHESTKEERAYIKKVNENVTYHEYIQIKNNILLRIIYHY